MLNRRSVLIGTLAAAGSAGVLAQTSESLASYPSRAIRLVVGFPPGGPTDIMARLFAEKLSESFGGAPVIVDNRPGAGTTVATDHVAKSKPDGYTYLVATLAGQGLAPSIYPNLPYDPQKDLIGVSHLASTPCMLVVHPSLPVKSVRELVAYLKAQPGKLNYANTGSGTSQHMAMELFKHLAGVDVMAVNYRGSAPAIVDLLSGHTQLMMDNIPSVGQHVRSGKLRALGVTSKVRVPAFPDVPTLQEEGVTGYELVSWFGLVAPAGVPKAIVDRVGAEATKFAAGADFTKRLADLGATPVGSSPAQFDSMIRTELAKWAPIIKAAGVKVQ